MKRQLHRSYLCTKLEYRFGVFVFIIYHQRLDYALFCFFVQNITTRARKNQRILGQILSEGNGPD